MKKEYFNLQIKTPLWTGDIDSKSDLLQSTGIIGSLRWWTEVILRGIDKFECEPAGDTRRENSRKQCPKDKFACDPAKDERCPKEKKYNDKKISQYCPACLIFGATGVRRLFRLEISGGTKVFDGGAINIVPDGRKGGRKDGWYLGSGLVGKIDLHVIPLDRDFDDNLVLVPLAIAANWGGIGAKTQHGYGIVDLENKNELKFENFESGLNKILNKHRLQRLNIEERKETNDVLPNIKEMFFAKVQFEVQNDEWWREVDGIKQALEPKDRQGKIDKEMQDRNNKILEAWLSSVSVPISPAIKNWLRYGDGKKLWQSGNQGKDGKIENWLLGTTERVCSRCYEKVKKDRNNSRNFWCSNCKRSIESKETIERIAAKINISCAYKINDTNWEFRIWWWIPEKENPNGFDRNNFLKGLKQVLNENGATTIPWTKLLGDQTKNHRLKVWREFNSSRDTVKANESDINSYLQSLLEDKGGT
ncbi:MAG: type III-B CRISPR module RAMP protein Cmr1 [Candidatus Pacearchaeota archaeon]|nr:type III-B CRISPR module RAMP protein Cmr1 [Candidatus Pacearchaeota archaeon]